MRPTGQSAGNEFMYLNIISVTIKDFFYNSSCIIHYSQWPKGVLQGFSLLLMADDWQNNDLQFFHLIRASELCLC